MMIKIQEFRVLNSSEMGSFLVFWLDKYPPKLGTLVLSPLGKGEIRDNFDKRFKQFFKKLVFNIKLAFMIYFYVFIDILLVYNIQSMYFCKYIYICF